MTCIFLAFLTNYSYCYSATRCTLIYRSCNLEVAKPIFPLNREGTIHKPRNQLKGRRGLPRNHVCSNGRGEKKNLIEIFESKIFYQFCQLSQFCQFRQFQAILTFFGNSAICQEGRVRRRQKE